VTPPHKKTSEQASDRLPPDLAGPVDVELTYSLDVIPTAFKPGTLAIEPKLLRGFRDLSVVHVGGDCGDLLRTRSDLSEPLSKLGPATPAPIVGVAGG
jgi:hypothetical protein